MAPPRKNFQEKCEHPDCNNMVDKLPCEKRVGLKRFCSHSCVVKYHRMGQVKEHKEIIKQLYPHTKNADIAAKLGLTKRMVSWYVRIMRAEGLIPPEIKQSIGRRTIGPPKEKPPKKKPGPKPRPKEPKLTTKQSPMPRKLPPKKQPKQFETKAIDKSEYIRVPIYKGYKLVKKEKLAS